MWNHPSKIGHCNHSLLSSVYHSPLAIVFIRLLMTTKNIISFIVPLSVKGFLAYCRVEKFYTAISSIMDLSNKFVDWKCFRGEWCLMNAFRLNCFIISRQVHRSLSCFDDKRCILKNGINTLTYGHKDI